MYYSRLIEKIDLPVISCGDPLCIAKNSNVSINTNVSWWKIIIFQACYAVSEKRKKIINSGLRFIAVDRQLWIYKSEKFASMCSNCFCTIWTRCWSCSSLMDSEKRLKARNSCGFVYHMFSICHMYPVERNQVPTMTENRPFYSCLFSDLTFVWQWGKSCPCFDTDLTAFVV